MSKILITPGDVHAYVGAPVKFKDGEAVFELTADQVTWLARGHSERVQPTDDDNYQYDEVRRRELKRQRDARYRARKKLKAKARRKK